MLLDDRISAATVIAADGANSRVRRALGVAPQPRSRTGLAIRGYAAGDLDRLHIGFVRDRWPAYVWAFPTGTGLVNVGYGPFDARTIERRERPRHLAARRSCPTSCPTRPACGPTTFRCRPPDRRRSRGRVLLAGDAASFVNPLTGEGIYYALL